MLVSVAEGMTNQLIICRIYACIADMLGYMAGSGGGIRGGPAGNLSWKGAFNLLEVSEPCGVVYEAECEHEHSALRLDFTSCWVCVDCALSLFSKESFQLRLKRWLRREPTG